MSETRRLTNVTQVRLSPAQHAFLSTLGHDLDVSMGAILRGYVVRAMEDAAAALGREAELHARDEADVLHDDAEFGRALARDVQALQAADES